MTSLLLATMLSIVVAVPQQRTAPPAQKQKQKQQQPVGSSKPATPPAKPSSATPPPATPPPAASTTPPKPASEPPPPTAPAQPTTALQYVVGAEDELAINVIGEADMTRTYRVASSGKIEFPQVGQVQAAGLTVSAIEKSLMKSLSEYIRQPQVSVEVAVYRSQKVYVQGDVLKTGPYVLQGPTSLLDILSQAGWNPSTGGDEIQIIHPRFAINGPLIPSQNLNADVQMVSVSDLQSGKLLTVAIRDGDTIFVPQAPTFFIQGQVRSPGEYKITQGMTVGQAIIKAGGMTERGTDGRLKVLRLVNGKPKELNIKTTERVQKGDTITVAQRWF